jgi:two-component system, chemotaxis family, sensor kinase CheA
MTEDLSQSELSQNELSQNDFSQDAGLVQDFLVECEELLQGMDQDMVALESSPQDADRLNRIFRAMHTIKGTSSFLGFEPIVRLSHHAEDVLNSVRRGEIRVQRRTMDALLASRDQLGIMLQHVREGGLQHYNLEPLLQELEETQKCGSPPTLGDLLVHDHVITPSTLKALLAEQAASLTPRRLGQMLVDKGLTSPVQIGDALVRQKEIASFAASATLRVEARKLDELINLIGELVLERNRLVQLERDFSSTSMAAGDFNSVFSQSIFSQSVSRLSFITEELQAVGLKTRMVPIEAVFRKFPRLVRDVALNLKKEVELVVRGQDTELDKTMAELIGDPLVHLVRNALDHGLETPEVRVQLGKPRQGTIVIAARQEGDQIVISVSDDGAGIDPERIGRKAVEKGLVTAERLRLLSQREILDFIFLPGFSTVEKASDLSGRGVGMDVVRSNLRRMNGSVEIDSRPGQGTTILLRVPLTLAILPVLLVRVADETYALPLHSVVETAAVLSQNIHRVEGSEVLWFRGETLPLIRLELLLEDKTRGNDGLDGQILRAAERGWKAVILGISEKRVALLVDHLLGQESTVIKPLGAYLRHCPSLAGGTISGDGRVRLVLDPAGLVAASAKMRPANVVCGKLASTAPQACA